MITGIVAGQMRTYGSAPVEDTPEFVATSETPFVTATSVSVTIPAAIQAGDLLVAAIMHRTALSSVPAGWALVENIKGVSDPFNQELSVYAKVAGAGDPGSTFTASTGQSLRMSCNVCGFRASAPLAVLSSAQRRSTPSDGKILIPGMLVGDSIVAAYSAAASSYASTTALNTFVCPSGFTQITPSTSNDTANQIRLGAAWRHALPSATVSGEWTINIAVAFETGLAVGLLIGAAP